MFVKSGDSTLSDIFTKLPSVVGYNEPPQYSEVFKQEMEMGDLTEVSISILGYISLLSHGMSSMMLQGKESCMYICNKL